MSQDNAILNHRNNSRTPMGIKLPGPKTPQEIGLAEAKEAIKKAFLAGVNPFGIISEMELICEELSDENYKQRNLWRERRVCVQAAGKGYQKMRAETFTPSSTLGLRS